MLRTRKLMIQGCTVLFCLLPYAFGESTTTQAQIAGKTVETVWPGLASASLTKASLGILPKGVILKSASLEITEEDLDRQIKAIPQADRGEYRKNAFFVLENMATRKLLLLAAGKPINSQNSDKIIQAHLKSVASDVKVTNRDIAEYFKNNRDFFSDESFTDSRIRIEKYLVKEKQQKMIDQYIRNLANIIPVTLSEAWTKQQAKVMLANPVDQTRRCGMPAMVEFGTEAGRTPSGMGSLLSELKKKYAGKAKIVFVEVRREKVLAARNDIREIPIQIFFDKRGMEIYRHRGSFTQKQIEEQFLRMGVK